VDVVDNVGRANGMLVSPTLFGLTHDELVEEERERKEASNYDGGTGFTTLSIPPLTYQKPLLQLRLEKALLEFAKLPLLMRMTLSESLRHLDRLSPGYHQMHG
jgi:hypothetical protein